MKGWRARVGGEKTVAVERSPAYCFVCLAPIPAGAGGGGTGRGEAAGRNPETVAQLIFPIAKRATKRPLSFLCLQKSFLQNGTNFQTPICS